MTTSTEILVSLDVYEIRALRFAGNAMGVAIGGELGARGEQRLPTPDGRLVPANESALMKLETALLAAGEQL